MWSAASKPCETTSHPVSGIDAMGRIFGAPAWILVPIGRGVECGIAAQLADAAIGSGLSHTVLAHGPLQPGPRLICRIMRSKDRAER